MASLSTAAVLARRFAAALADGRTLVVGDHVRRMGGFGGVFSGPAASDPDRVLDLPIADRGSLGFALGVALSGRRVIVELASTGRVWAGLEVLAEAGAIASAREFPVPLLVRVPCGGQAGEAIDRSVTDALTSLEGVSVLAPSDAAGLLGAWEHALASQRPTVVLEPRQLLRTRTLGVAADAPAASGLRVLRAGSDVTLVSFGSGTSIAVDAAESLASEGVQAHVVDLVALAPLDRDALGAAVRATGRAVFVQAPEGGMAGQAVHAAVQQAFLYLEAPLSVAKPSVEAVREAALDAAFY